MVGGLQGSQLFGVISCSEKHNTNSTPALLLLGFFFSSIFCSLAVSSYLYRSQFEHLFETLVLLSTFLPNFSFLCKFERAQVKPNKWSSPFLYSIHVDHCSRSKRRKKFAPCYSQLSFIFNY